jgi:glycosyltransferase involved in cell wall biosynthesis
VYRRPPQWWRYVRRLQSSLKHVDAFIAPSRFIGNIHQQLNIPIVHLPNFVPSDSLEEEPSSGAVSTITEKPFFLFVGRLEKIKGVQTLIPVFRNYPKANLLIAGAGSYEGRLKQLAGDSPNIRFLGHLTDRQLQAIYSGTSAVIVPSLWFENLPLVVLEAFKQQTPVIVRNLGALPEVITASGGGFLYNTNKELVAAMDRLLSEPSLSQKLGKKGYGTYTQEWTTEVHLRRYFALIGEIAARRKRSTG